MSNWNQVYFQDSSTLVNQMIIFMHDQIHMILVLILSLLVYIMAVMMINKFVNRDLTKNHMIEIIWTLVPMVLLIFIAFPSIFILYFMEEVCTPKLTIKSLGHQWYWSYEYSDFKNLEFDSYMLPLKDLNKDMFRLLEVDNVMSVPYKSSIRMLISSTDVIHSWSLPSASVKVDGIPGRMNQASLIFMRPGIFYGQCSEICGANHSFMPIVVESMKFSKFMNWVMS